jgi:uncharacterized protein (TIGR03067 family)
MKLALCLAIFSGLALASDQDSIQGKWKLMAGLRDGQPLTGEGLNAMLTIEGNKFTVTQGGQTVSGTFTLNEGGSPRAADLTTDAGTLQAIYDIRGGNRFRVAVGRAGAARPSKFESRAGSGVSFGEWVKAK